VRLATISDSATQARSAADRVRESPRGKVRIHPGGSAHPAGCTSRRESPPVRYSCHPCNRSLRCGRNIISTARRSSSNICSSTNRSTPSSAVLLNMGSTPANLVVTRERDTHFPALAFMTLAHLRVQELFRRDCHPLCTPTLAPSRRVIVSPLFISRCSLSESPVALPASPQKKNSARHFCAKVGARTARRGALVINFARLQSGHETRQHQGR
jgi:hypothetical protein